MYAGFHGATQASSSGEAGSLQLQPIGQQTYPLLDATIGQIVVPGSSPQHASLW